MFTYFAWCMRQTKNQTTGLGRARHGGEALSGSPAEIILIERVNDIGLSRSGETCGSADSRDRIPGINIGFPDLGECECKRRPIGRPADAQIAGRRSVTWRRIMKTLIAALALAILIAAPAVAPSATAATNAGPNASQSGQNYNGYYRGYPLEDWYRADSW